MKPERFGMLMGALNTFAKEISKTGLDNFSFNQKRYTLKKVKDFLFVANSSTKHPSKKVNREMESLANTFFKVYDEELLERFDGELSILENCEECFREEIKDSLEEPVKNFWEGIINR
jgi:hypothetical protein